MKLSRLSLVAIVAALAAFCAACQDTPASGNDTGASSDGTAPPLCMPGRIATCPCPDGRAGRQECGSDGVWGDCDCGDTGTATDGGADTTRERDALADTTDDPEDTGQTPDDTAEPSDTSDPDTGTDSGDGDGIQGGGPPNPNDWEVVFRDDFDQGSLDTDKWSVGFGWGKQTDNSPEVIRADEIEVRDDILRLSVTREDDGDIYAGSVNTKNKRTYGPGTYWEARINPPKRTGFLPAFWAKPDSEAWPPEIDFMELFQADYRGEKAWTNPHYNIHYSHAGCGSGSDNTAPVDYDSGMDVTRDYHVYGAMWLRDRVEFYFDGQKVGEVTNDTALDQIADCAPFYMMLNIHVDKVGTTDKSEQWDETMDVDWVRVWETN